MSRYEFIKGTSKKFWEIERTKQTLTVRWGRIGAAGRNEKVYKLASEEAAVKQHDKLVAEKLGKGYRPASDAAGKAHETSKPSKSPGASKARAPWLAKVKPTLEIRGKGGRTFDVSGEPPVKVDVPKVEKNLGLPLGPVMRDFIALSEATYP